MVTISDLRRQTARRLRADATEAEIRLWRYLRQTPLDGSHFRRQVPLGPYVADFACMAAKLIIELDGSQHAEDKNKLKDDERTRWLAAEGYRVIRFWNNDIVENIDGVLETIYKAIYGSRDFQTTTLKHKRRRRAIPPDGHPTPARFARRPSPSRGG
jgi:very-short-patch-repair endonuclease